MLVLENDLTQRERALHAKAEGRDCSEHKEMKKERSLSFNGRTIRKRESERGRD